MARRRLISDEDLFEKFEEYVINECSNDISLFKLPKFGDYLRTTGFPEVADTTLRRNKKFRLTIEKRKAEAEDEEFQTIITYKTLDIDSFMMTNRTPRAIRSALVELNKYYKRIVEVALKYKDEAEVLVIENKKLQEHLQTATSNSEERKALIDENNALKSIIKTTVYPEIANELLKAEGLLKSENRIISEEYLASQIITADSKIDFQSESTNTDEVQNKIVNIKNLLDSKTNY
ncbi:hypothetical protein NKE50_06050 [Streptococcus suis]|uniref:hypothetical protein n=1 Tax=Streptococcus suis TaxID=1307 RepID=UPI00209BC8AC|nr:hypothetical protein [Streptococcus suis]MCO8204216.1 hypothetical protein [Streptococcus suis]MCO8204936.1 hypothetical protein [Streptococcus suis]HEM3455425.1 hypothetical protein [Streptococcus suis]